MPVTDDRPRPAGPVRVRRRRWTALLVVVAVAAVLAPVGWLVSRPAEDAGAPLAEVLATPAGTVAPPAPPAAPAAGRAGAGTGSTPDVTGATAEPSVVATPPGPRAAGGVAVRDASLPSLPRRGPLPVRLRVPSLGVDAAVDAVGVEDDGSMVVPAEVDRVGWYRYGPEAGAAEGNAVLAGHVDTVAQGPGALFELRGVAVGAEVVVTDASGTDHRYEVVSRESVTKTDLPVDAIFARAGVHRLVVITCGGDYLPGSRRYEDNVVVTAVPVPAT